MAEATLLSTISSDTNFLLADHVVHGLFHVNLDFASTEKLESTLDSYVRAVCAIRASELPTLLQLRDPQPHLQDALWEPHSGRGMALDDFYPYARQILGAKDEDTTVCVNLSLSSEGVQALTQFKGGKPRYWQLFLGNAAQTRCGQETINLAFCKARIFLFRTGVVILDLSWRYGIHQASLPASVVQEGNYLLSHGNYVSKSPTEPKNKTISGAENHTGSQSFTAPGIRPTSLDAQQLLKVAQALLPQSWMNTATLQPNRLLLYSLVRVHGGTDIQTMLELGIRLSHRQTSDYRPNLQSMQSNVLRPFPYLSHVLAPEGAASIIAAEDTTSGFFTNFVNGSGANTYVPLFVMSLHNHLWLLKQTEWLPMRSKGGKRREVHDLEEVYERTVEFRRFFYFPMISQISLHNMFYESSQDVFKIAERQRFLEQTTHDIAELLKARRSKWIGRISGAVAGFLVTHEVLDIISQSGLPWTIPNLHVWLAELLHADPLAIESMVRLAEKWDLVIFLGSLAGAVLGYWAAWYFDKSPKTE